MRQKSFLTRNIWVLSIVSFFTDIAGEMLYPIMPLYLKTIGFSVIFIGLLEGLAEATAGLSKGYFGNWSDKNGRRLPFVQIGYGLSAISKPLMTLLALPIWVFLMRTLDRLGKGIRTGARDAILSDETTPEFKGRVFGFHRSLDTLGAVGGPLLALIYLTYYPNAYKSLFLWSFIPGCLAILLTFLIREKSSTHIPSEQRPALWDFVRYWKNSPRPYRQLVGALLFFTLFNSSDIFLILKIKESGFSDSTAISVYIFYNLIYALAAYPLGIKADKWGMKTVYVLGLFMFAGVYGSMAWATDSLHFYIIFLFYGLYAAATEGIAKAWISNICDKKDTATAIGTFTAFQSIFALIASTMAGIIWANFGSFYTFILTALMSIAVAIYISYAHFK